MARKHLIHFHTSGVNRPSVDPAENGIVLGEIAVQHNVEAPKLIIATATGATPTFAEFIDSAAVDVKIAAAVSAATADLSAIKSVLSGYSGESAVKNDVDGVKDGLADEITARTAGDAAIEDALGEGFSSAKTVASEVARIDSAVTAEASARTAADETLSGRIDATESDIEGLQSIVSGFTSASSIYNAVQALADEVADEITARTSADTTLQNAINAEVSARTSAVSGLQDEIGTGFTANNSVRDEVDSLDGRLDEAESDISDLQETVSGLSSGSLTEILPTASTTTNYVTIQVSAKQDAKQTISASAVTHDVADAVASTADGLAVASDVKAEIKKVDDKLGTGVTSSNTATAQFSAITTDITGLQTQLGDGFSVTSVTNQLAAVKSVADSALQSVSHGTDSGSFVSLGVASKSNNDQVLTVSSVTQDVSAATANDNGLAVALDVKNYVSAETSGMSSDVATLKQQLLGINAEDSGVTKYIDSKLSSVYVYKGSCTYAELPATGNVTGDVWNVTDAHDNVPAGTNWAWNGTAWDPLAGSIDTSVFMQTSAFTAWTGTTYYPAISGLTDDVTAISGDVSTLTSNVLYSVSSGSSNDYITVTVGTKDANKNQTIDVTAKTVDVSAATAASDGLAVAYDVKQEIKKVDDKFGTGVTSSNTATAQFSAIATDITGLSDRLGTGVTSANTATAQLANIKATADGAVQSVSVKNTATNLITATEDSTTHNVEFDFDSMVIDCGSY